MIACSINNVLGSRRWRVRGRTSSSSQASCQEGGRGSGSHMESYIGRIEHSLYCGEDSSPRCMRAAPPSHLVIRCKLRLERSQPELWQPIQPHMRRCMCSAAVVGLAPIAFAPSRRVAMAGLMVVFSSATLLRYLGHSQYGCLDLLIPVLNFFLQEFISRYSPLINLQILSDDIEHHYHLPGCPVQYCLQLRAPSCQCIK